MMGSRIFTYLGFFVLLVAIPCPATTWTVDDDGPADFASIQDAINAAWHGDIIEVQSGTYTESIYFNSLAITVTSTDPNDPSVVADTIIEATSQYAVRFDFLEGPDSVITGFTITGGGINCMATSATITHNIIRDCSNTCGIEGSYGAAPIIEYNKIKYNQGGISSCQGPIRHNLITENDGISSGGGLSECGGDISGNEITNNEAKGSGHTYGGGLYNCGGTISDNVISGNRAESTSYDAYGGGLHECDGEISDNEIIDNETKGDDYTYGGGLSRCDGAISGNTISGNRTVSTIYSSYGGGLYECNGEISGNEITNNEAKGNGDIRGGGLHNCGGTISGNIISGNRAESTDSNAFGGGLSSCESTISGNIITGNRAESTNNDAYGGGINDCGTIKNNTIIGNITKTDGGGLYECSTVKNNIIVFNEANLAGGIYGSCNNSYNCFWFNEGGNFGGGGFGKVGDIRQNPLFAVDGYWDPNDTPADESDDIWVEEDYYLQSAGGRYTDMGWVIDDANSPCIDSGDPSDDVGDEPEPHGDRINMGAYGGTAYASKTPDGPGQVITFPNTVQNLALSGGPGQLTVHWDDPNYDGGLPIEQFMIYRGPSELALTFLTQVAGNVHEYIDSEVVNGQTYCTGSVGIGHLAVTVKRMICQRQIKVFQGIGEFWITFADSSDKFVKPKDRRPARLCEATA